MSGTTGKKTIQATPAKTKKRSSRKKVAKTSTRKTPGSATTVKKKPVTKKAAAKKTTTRKPSKKAISSKKTATTPRKKTRTPKQADTASAGKTPENTRSLSWMSAQAASALKAVKASQAEKGHTILARTRKQSADKHIDDESLIEIAAGMPVDNDGLIEFSTEAPVEEQSRQIEAPLAAPESAGEETTSNTDIAANSVVEAETEQTDEVVEMPVEPAQQAEPCIKSPLPPPQPGKRSALFHPALAAGILLLLMSGYYFWPNGNDTQVSENSAAVATQENTAIETPVAAAEPDPVEPEITTMEDTTTTLITEPGQESPESSNAWTPAGISRTWEPSTPRQTAVVPPEPEAEPVAVEPQPTVAKQVPPPAQPAAPIQRNYRAPVYGAYPQQRQPAYPQRYYR
jgi:hypothetical protein